MTARWRVEREWDGLWHAEAPGCRGESGDKCLFTTDWAEAVAHADAEARKAPTEVCS